MAVFEPVNFQFKVGHESTKKEFVFCRKFTFLQILQSMLINQTSDSFSPGQSNISIVVGLIK